MLRGAIFFIGMALWGSNRVQTLRYPPAAVLAGFLQVCSPYHLDTNSTTANRIRTITTMDMTRDQCQTNADFVKIVNHIG